MAEGLGDLTGPWQLFVDDYVIASRDSGIVRTYHPFEKYTGNPVLVADEDWEGTIVYIYGTVLPNETRTGWRMWYQCAPPDPEVNTILYATSADGVHWTKPELGIRARWNGSTANNLFFPRTTENGIASIIHTPWDPDPNRAYKIVNYDYGGFWGAYSPDGIHLTDLPDNPVFNQGGDVGQFLWDPFTQQYLGYVKVNPDVNGLRRRAVARIATNDISMWPAPELVLAPDTFDDRWVPPGTAQRTHHYGMSVFAYESMYLGFLWVFRATDVEGYYNGPVFAELASSRDGIHWLREEGNRPRLLDLGPPGSWDDGQLYTATAPVLEASALRVYYGACDQEHGARLPDTTCSIGMAMLRKDGFVSLDAPVAGGSVLTELLEGAAGSLHVNFKATSGWLKVEVLNETGGVVGGYGGADCNLLEGDRIDQVVSWGIQTELPPLPGPFRLRFIMQNASLYSFMAGPAVHVLAAPKIALHPVDQLVPLTGGVGIFAIQATGEPPLVYQWQRNGTDLSDGGACSGATTTTLTVTNPGCNDAGDYRCVVSSPYGSVTSDEATLTLTGARFTGVGILPGGTSSTVAGISSDGSIACGSSAGKAFIWTPSGGIKDVGLPSGATISSATGVGFYNGTVVAAVNCNAAAFKARRWDGNTSGVGVFTNLPKMDGTLEWTALGLGTDGTSDLWISGSSVNGGDGGGRSAGRFKQSSNSTSSLSLPPSGHDNSDCHGTSDNGCFAGQYQYLGTPPTGGARNAMKNTGSPTALYTLLGPPSTKNEAVAKAISRNGLVQGGWSYYSGGGTLTKPVIWNNSTVPTAVGFIPGDDNDNSGEILALNGDGTLAGGYSFYDGISADGPREALIWNPTNGPRPLQEVLTTQYGLDLTGWTLQEMRGISSDGNVLTGIGLHNGNTEGWVVALNGLAPEMTTITQHPQPQKACPAGLIAFHVTATGGGTLSYQWQKNRADLSDGGQYSGVTTDTLTISCVDRNHLAAYRCVVTGCGSATSNEASLTIAPYDADFDIDGDVDGFDFLTFSNCFNGSGRPPAPSCPSPEADIDADGDVDGFDFLAFSNYYNGSGTPPNCP